MENEIQRVLEYYAIFQYAPTVKQLWSFLPARRQLRQLKMGRGIIVEHDRVVLNKNKSWIALSITRERISREKIEKGRGLLLLFGKLPWVKFIGVSGSVAAMNANESDDVDLFVIASKNHLWTARFCLTVLSMIIGKRRGRTDQTFKDKLCFNLFFTEADLVVPENKHTEYVAHEILQVVPIVNKDETYEQFLYANRWVQQLFPNVKNVIASPADCGIDSARQSRISTRLLRRLGLFAMTTFLGSLVEWVLMKFQLQIISRHRTRELITETQLWFFPDDFALKIPKRMIYSL